VLADYLVLSDDRVAQRHKIVAQQADLVQKAEVKLLAVIEALNQRFNTTVEAEVTKRSSDSTPPTTDSAADAGAAVAKKADNRKLITLKASEKRGVARTAIDKSLLEVISAAVVADSATASSVMQKETLLGVGFFARSKIDDSEITQMATAVAEAADALSTYCLKPTPLCRRAL